MKVPIADGFYRSSSLPMDAQRCVNAYPVVLKTENFERQSLFGTPGLSELVDLGSHCRGAIEMDEIPYFVNGGNLYRLDRTVVDSIDTFSSTNLFSVSGSSRVSMAQNGNQIFILNPGGDGYVYNKTTATMSLITDPDFTANGNPKHVTFIDGYFVCTTDTRKFILSALNDGTSWNALDFGSAESDPDGVVVAHNHRGRLFILGGKTTQAFQNIGGSDFPFQAIPGLVMTKGCYAPFSLVDSNNTFMFVGGGENESPAVWAYSGNNFQKVSSHGIDYMLGLLSESELFSIVGWSYSERGSHFVGFTLDDTTIVFDVTSGRWHERRTRSYDVYGYAAETAWRITDIVRAYDRVIVGDRFDGKIGEASLDIYSEYGEEVLRYAVTQPLENGGKSFRMPRIEAMTESAAISTSENDPQIRLSLSRDGVVFGAERKRSIGKVGERNKRQVWRRNGRFDRRAVLKFSMSDPAPFRLIEVEADFA